MKRTAAAPTPVLSMIEELTADYATKRGALEKVVMRVEDGVRAVQARHADDVRIAAAAARDARAKLKTAIDENRPAFTKPKSRLFHGITVGLRKLVGKLTFDDEAKVVARIEKLFPDRVEDLIATKKIPVKAALQKLPGSDLKRLGCELEADCDVPVIKPPKSDVQKLVDALLTEPGEDSDSE